MLLQKKLLYLLPYFSPTRTAFVSRTHGFLLTSLRFSHSTSKTPSPESPFIVEYLIHSFGFSSDKATKASKHLAHLKTPSNPDSVRHFLKDHGFTDDDIRTAVSLDPKLLCARVEKTLNPRMKDLQDIGFSQAEIIQLVSSTPSAFLRRYLQRKIEFWIPLLGSVEKLLKAIKMNRYLLSSDLEKIVIPNIALLRECGVSDRQVAQTLMSIPRLLTTNHNSVKTIVRRAEELGVPRGSGLFWQALKTTSCLSRRTVDAKFRFLKNLGWSEEQISSAVIKAPNILRMSEENMRRSVEYLTTEVGCDHSYLSHRPIILVYSLEQRLIPRNLVLKILKARGLHEGGSDFYSAVVLSEEKFLKKFIHPHEQRIPGLFEDYLAARAGNVPIQGKLEGDMME
ncbi:transcription termination factor MTEF18, mitochondrial-like [Typha latifolia]|uniref:transcription termination factor MTEF18, mitochondrial-like n=1 Tax=Typha latifolia TaxID=4733 RepID=UPI003C2BBC11